MNRWNGFGGKVKEGESLLDAMKREVKEEAGISVRHAEEMGILDFSFENRSEVLEVHVFKATSFEDEPVETEEMRPQWFEISDIPFRDMWPDDVYWFPHFLKGRKFRGMFHFDESDGIMKRNLTIVDSLDTK